MKTLRLWAVTILFLGLVGGGLYLWWRMDLRWRPHEITKHQDEIGKILEGSGWVSPGLTGPKLYMVSYRACADCTRFEETQFPELQKDGVDTRVIAVARADVNGASKSTAAERSTVAELWVNRNWGLYQRWMAVSPDTWAAPGVPKADGDVARGAVVEVGRMSIERLTPLLKDNGINLAYPVLIWWTKDGKMMGCACERAETYQYVRKDLKAG
jgi:hypothetical protein